MFLVFIHFKHCFIFLVVPLAASVEIVNLQFYLPSEIGLCVWKEVMRAERHQHIFAHVLVIEMLLFLEQSSVLLLQKVIPCDFIFQQGCALI